MGEGINGLGGGPSFEKINSVNNKENAGLKNKIENKEAVSIEKNELNSKNDNQIKSYKEGNSDAKVKIFDDLDGEVSRCNIIIDEFPDLSPDKDIFKCISKTEIPKAPIDPEIFKCVNKKDFPIKPGDKDIFKCVVKPGEGGEIFKCVVKPDDKPPVIFNCKFEPDLEEVIIKLENKKKI